MIKLSEMIAEQAERFKEGQVVDIQEELNSLSWMSAALSAEFMELALEREQEADDNLKGMLLDEQSK